MAKPKISTRLFRASDRLRDKNDALATLLVEAADYILELEGSPERRRDLRFQRKALAYLQRRADT